MAKLKPCPVCGNRVDILCIDIGCKHERYVFSHHPMPSGFCILQKVLDGKPYTISKMDNMAKIWNIRDEKCHTVKHLDEVEGVDFY